MSQVIGIKEVVTAPRSPWQNAYVERLIGSIRRECLDHIIIFNEHHLRRVLSSYFQYHHQTRTHLALDKDCPRRARYTRHPLARSLSSRRSVVCIIATNVAPRELFRQTNRRHISAWSRSGSITTWLRCNGAQTPCMEPRSQPRPMYYSTNQRSSVTISSENRFPGRIDF